MVKAVDLGIVVSEFELQLCYYVHFRINTLGKGMNPLTSQLLYCHLQHHNDTIIKTHTGKLLYKYIYLSLYCKGSKRLFKVCVWEGAGDRTETAIFWPPFLWPSTLCLSRSPDAQPEALRSTLLGIGSIGVPEGPLDRLRLSRLHLVYLRLKLYWNCHWYSNSTELYNSSTPIRSPTRSLKSHV